MVIARQQDIEQERPKQANRYDAPAPPPTLRRSFSWTLLGYGLYSACNWLMLTALAKMGSKEMVGQYALGVAVTQPILTIAMLNLRSVQATDAQHRHRFGHCFALRLACLAVAVPLMTLAALDGGYSRQTAWVILVTGVGAAFDTVSDVFYGMFQQEERLDCMAISLSVKGPLSLLGLMLGLCLTGNVLWAVAGSALASALVVLGYDLPTGRRMLPAGRRMLDRERTPVDVSWAPLWEPRRMAELAWIALPLGVTTLLISLNTFVPRYFIEHSLGEGNLGIFAATTSIINVGRTVVISLGSAVIPRQAKLFLSGRLTEFRALTVKTTLLGALLGGASALGALFAGRWILTLLYTPEYARHADVFFLVMLGGGLSFVALFLSFAVTAAQQFRVQVPWYALTTAASALACWRLVPTMGLRGAALSVIVSALVQLALGLGIVAYILRPLRAGSRAAGEVCSV